MAAPAAITAKTAGNQEPVRLHRTRADSSMLGLYFQQLKTVLNP